MAKPFDTAADLKRALWGAVTSKPLSFQIKADEDGLPHIEVYVGEELKYSALAGNFDDWREVSDDGGPCCYGNVTSSGQFHEPGCPSVDQGV